MYLEVIYLILVEFKISTKWKSSLMDSESNKMLREEIQEELSSGWGALQQFQSQQCV